MKGHLGALMTTGLAAIALVLALLQAAVLFHSAPRNQGTSSASSGQTNRFSVPGGRSGVPWIPFDKAQPPSTTKEGRSPQKQQEERRSPPPYRQRGAPPAAGPRPQPRAAA